MNGVHFSGRQVLLKSNNQLQTATHTLNPQSQYKGYIAIMSFPSVCCSTAYLKQQCDLVAKWPMLLFYIRCKKNTLNTIVKWFLIFIFLFKNNYNNEI